MARQDDIVQLDPASLLRMQRRFRQLGDGVLGTALQGALNETVLDANRRMKRVFERDIEGGPARFTEINPGTRKSAVIERPGRYATGATEATAALVVSPLQSTYLKYSLGEATVRMPGDVGMAKDVNLTPVGRNLSLQGTALNAQGNLPRNVVKSFVKRAKAGKAPPVIGRNGKPKKKKPPKFAGLFYGRPFGPSSPMGFWQRPAADAAPGTGLRLIAVAQERSEYRKAHLVPGWNRSVLDAAKGIPERYEASLEEAMTARGGGNV